MALKRGLLGVLSTMGLVLSMGSAVELYPIERPIRWSNIPVCYAGEIPKGTTFRSLEAEEVYGVWKAEMREKNIKIPDYVKEKVLGFGGQPKRPMFYLRETKLDGQTVPVYSTGDAEYLSLFVRGMDEATQRDGIRISSSFILLTKNDFPYDLEEGVEHWLIWANRGYKLEQINLFLRETLAGQVEWQIYENAAHLKSIPQISHYQLFIRFKPAG